MIKIFEIEDTCDGCLKVHSRSHCEERVIIPSDKCLKTPYYGIYVDTLINLVSQIPGVVNVKKINPYCLRVDFAKLFSYEEIKGKITSIYWFHNFTSEREYDTLKERNEILNRIMSNEGNHWPYISGD
jgi:hypothetical protein